MTAHKWFAAFDEAFDYCRETGHPVVVLVGNEVWKLYPSGRAVFRGKQGHGPAPKEFSDDAEPRKAGVA